MSGLHLLRLTDDAKQLIEPAWLAKAAPVHRQLRPNLSVDYVSEMQGVIDDGGELVVAVEGHSVVAVALYRCYRDTYCGKQFYVDDLVVDAGRRSQGVGQVMLRWLETTARERGAHKIIIDSNTQRHGAHRFYLREGFDIACFNFTKTLNP